ncbi:MAG TPA: phosphatidylglycerol lysyltransferase domain-containing protein [Anaerolineales bacterium]|nr:phosphatidylglycerol lysyltransferase domain-containing protein [Anaerolineales bacterium]
MKSKFALSEENMVRLVALLTAVMGVVNVLSAVTPAVMDRLHVLEEYSPFRIIRGGHLASALAGFALLLLSVGLWRRKQMAWLLTLSILTVSIPVHLLKGLDYEEAVLAASLVGLLLYLRPRFHARSDPPSVMQGLQVLLAALAFTLVYGVVGLYLLDHHFKVNFGVWAAIRQTVVMFTQFYDPGLQPVTRFGRYFADSIYIIGAMTISYALLMILRPVLSRRVPTEEERAHAWEIIRAYGRTPLARYALFDDKLFFFTPGGSLLSYVVENRTALVLGDPIGPAEDTGPAVTAFKECCAQNDWVPAFYQVLPDNLDVYKSTGLDALLIGHEAVVKLDRFTLEGSVNKTLRNTYNKMVRNGYHYDVIQPPYSARMLHELSYISNDWLTMQRAVEMRFSLGWFDEAYLNACPILLVRDREGFIEAFANLVPEFQTKEIAVDLMRYRSQSESGLMDFLFVSLFQWAREQGYDTFNLGLSALSGVGEHSDDPIIERTLSFIYQNINRVYNFRGLHFFKEKFHPVWVQRYLVYPGAPSLPIVSAALVRANLGGGIFSVLRRD